MEVKLQKEIDLLTAEAECISLYSALRETILIMRLLKEISTAIDAKEATNSMNSAAFEDYNGSLELSKAPTMRPCTKHAAIKYHHSRPHAAKGNVIIKKVDTAEQYVDFCTKSLLLKLFCYLQKKVMCW